MTQRTWRWLTGTCTDLYLGDQDSTESLFLLLSKHSCWTCTSWRGQSPQVQHFIVANVWKTNLLVSIRLYFDFQTGCLHLFCYMEGTFSHYISAEWYSLNQYCHRNCLLSHGMKTSVLRVSATFASLLRREIQSGYWQDGVGPHVCWVPSSLPCSHWDV